MYVYKVSMCKSTNRDSKALLSLMFIFFIQKNNVSLRTRLTPEHELFLYVANTAVVVRRRFPPLRT